MPDEIDAAEYREGVYKISDNIETAEDKRIAVFSSNPEIARDLGELNKAVVINHNMFDMMRELISEHSEIEVIASFGFTENDSAAIYCNDPSLSEFMSAFMRMHGTRANCSPLDTPFLKLEDLEKKFIRIDIPGSHKNKLTILVDGMASFLDGNLYLFNKKLYASREEWEHDISLMLRSMLSNIMGMFKTVSPEGINSVVNSTMAKVDPRYTNQALLVVKNVVDDIKKEGELADKRAEMKIAKEKKILKTEKTNIQKQLLPTENALQELQKERELITDSRGELETKIQKLEAGRRQLGLQKRELEKALAEYKETKIRYKEEQKALDAAKTEKRGIENELLHLQRLKTELEKEKKELLEKRSQAEKMAMELEEEKSGIFKEKFRLTELLSKLRKEKTDVDAKKSGLENLRGRIAGKKLEAKTRFVRRKLPKKIYKAKQLKTKFRAPKPNAPKLIPTTISDYPERIGFYRLKSKWPETIHKRKRLGAWVLERKN